MIDASYPPARAVAGRVHAHLEQQFHAARERGEIDLAGPPDLPTIQAIIDAAFWASLRREEGYTPTISLALLPPERAVRPLIFQPSVALAAEALARLAPAVKSSGMHLGVWPARRGAAGTSNPELCVWGVTRTLPALCFVLEVIAPGRATMP